MIWYRLLDFLKSRLGQVLVFCLAIIAVFLWVAARERNAKDADLNASALPTLGSRSLWDDPKPMGQGNEDADQVDYIVPATKENFRAFKSPPLVAQAKAAPRPTAPENPSLLGAGFPLPPLIQFEMERAGEKSVSVDSKRSATPSSPSTEPGALLHCRLLSPVSSDQGDAPVRAQIVRPLIREGRVVIPRGTRLSGRLGSVRSERMFFQPEWQLELADGDRIVVRGHVQEAAIDPVAGIYAQPDGRAGLPVRAAQPAEKERAWTRPLGIVTAAVSRLAQDRTRTALGEHIPGTTRNVVLGGSSELIEDYVNGLRERETDSDEHPPEFLYQGQYFYLQVSTQQL